MPKRLWVCWEKSLWQPKGKAGELPFLYPIFVIRLCSLNPSSMKTAQFTVYIEQDEDGMFIGSVPTVPSCHAEGRTQEEMLQNLSEVLKLCLRNIKSIQKNKFVGIQNLELSHA